MHVRVLLSIVNHTQLNMKAQRVQTTDVYQWPVMTSAAVAHAVSKLWPLAGISRPTSVGGLCTLMMPSHA